MIYTFYVVTVTSSVCTHHQILCTASPHRLYHTYLFASIHRRLRRRARRHRTQPLLRVLRPVLTPHGRLRIPDSTRIIQLLDRQLLRVVRPIETLLPVRILRIRLIHIRAPTRAHRRQLLERARDVRGDEGAGVDVGLEGRSVVVGLADDDVDDAAAPGGEDGVRRDGLGDGEVGVHDGFDHDVAAVEEGAEGLRQRGGLAGDDAAGDEPAAPLEGAGAEVGEEAQVGFVEGGVGVGCEVVGEGRVLEFQSVELVGEGLEEGDGLGLG